MEERRSLLSSMAWKRLQPYLCDPPVRPNSMFSNFCHVLKNYINKPLFKVRQKLYTGYKSPLFKHFGKYSNINPKMTSFIYHALPTIGWCSIIGLQLKTGNFAAEQTNDSYEFPKQRRDRTLLVQVQERGGATQHESGELLPDQ